MKTMKAKVKVVFKNALVSLLCLALISALPFTGFGGKAIPKASAVNGPAFVSPGEISTSSSIYFGNYTQSAIAGGFTKEAIEWLVLENDALTGNSDGKMLLLSKKILDSHAYQSSGGYPDWSTTGGIRAWLNDGFKGSAFTADERGMISSGTSINTRIRTGENETVSAITTKDSIFLLSENIYETPGSIKNSAYGLNNDSARVASVSAYASSKGVGTDASGGAYWLRSCEGGSQVSNAAIIGTAGNLTSAGVDAASIGVRPVLFLDLSSTLFGRHDETELGYHAFDPSDYPFTVNFHKNMDALNNSVQLSPSISAMEVTYGAMMGPLPKATLAGYTFRGWHDKADSWDPAVNATLYTRGSIYKTPGDLDLYAKFEYVLDSDYDDYSDAQEALAGSRPDNPADYPSEERIKDGKMVRTIAFEGNNPTPTPDAVELSRSTMEAVYGSSIGALAIASCAGYAFRGWRTTPQALGGEEISKGAIYKWNRDITAYAIWVGDSDNDGFTDEEEEIAGSDETDANDNPSKGSIEGGKMVRTIYFDKNAGNQNYFVYLDPPTPTTRKAVYGTSIPALPNVTRAGHTFRGWVDSETSERIINGRPYIFKRNLTLQAIYTDKPDDDFDGYTNEEEIDAGTSTTDPMSTPGPSSLEREIIFNKNMGTLNNSVQLSPSSPTRGATYGSPVGELPEATLAAHTFKGWYDNSIPSEGGTLYTRGSLYLTLGGYSLNLYAKFIEEPDSDFDGYSNIEETEAGSRPNDPGDYPSEERTNANRKMVRTITFNPSNGVWLSKSTMEAVYGSSIGALAIATRAGYAFAGWYDSSTTDQGMEYSSGSSYFVTGSLILYARWDKDSDNDGSTDAKENEAGSDKDDPRDYPTPGSVDVSGKMIRTITFYKNFGGQDSVVSLSKPTTEAVYGSSIGALAIATRAGYAFRGWYDKETWDETGAALYTSGSIYSVTKNLGLYARWDRDSDDDGYSDEEEAEAGSNTNSAIDRPDEENLDGNTRTMIRTIYFDGNTTDGAARINPTTTKAAYKSSIGALAKATHPSFTFKEWRDKSIPSEGALYTPGSIYKTIGNLTLYAIFLDEPDSDFDGYSDEEENEAGSDKENANDNLSAGETENNRMVRTITFDKNIEVTSDSVQLSKTTTRAVYDSPMSLGVATRAGYDFEGWRTTTQALGGEEVSEGAIYEWDRDITAYAIWAAKEYTLTLSALGLGENGEAVATYRESSLNVTRQSVRTGYSVVGYYADSQFEIEVASTDGALVTSVAGYTLGGKWVTTSAVTLYASWSALSYKVTFEPGTGAGISPPALAEKYISYGGIEVFPTPSRIGYSFLGWYSEEGGGSKVTDADGALVTAAGYTKNGGWATTSAVTLYAIWSAKSYKVTFVPGTGAGISPIPAEKYISYDGTEVFPTPSRIGYDFLGWYSEEGGGNKVASTDGALVTSVAGYTNDSGKWATTSAVTLYAIWSALSCEVTFEPGTGAGISTTGKSVFYDGSYDGTEGFSVPTKTGYSFLGWYTGAGGTGSSVTGTDGALLGNVAGYTKDGRWATTPAVTLYASWSALSCEVTFVPGTGAGVSTTKSVFYDRTEGFPVPTKTGYSFLGWYSGAGGTGSSVTGTNGALVTTAAGYTKDGRWATTAAVELYARWSAKSYEITFNGNSDAETWLSDTTAAAVYDTPVADLGSAKATCAGWTFKGWYDNSNWEQGKRYTEASIYQVPTNLALYAKFVHELDSDFDGYSDNEEIEAGTSTTNPGITPEHNGPEREIIFYGNMGGNPEVWLSKSTMGAVYGSSIGALETLATATFAGYTFRGWYNKINWSDGDATHYTSGSIYLTLGKSLKLYARFEHVLDSDYDGYSDTEEGNKGSRPSDPNDRPDEENLDENSSTMVRTIHFDKNTSDSAVLLDFATMRAVYGSPGVGEFPSPHRDWHGFRGWTTEPGVSGEAVAIVSAGTIYGWNHDITAYAIWVVDSDEDGYSDDEENEAGSGLYDPSDRPEPENLDENEKMIRTITFNKNSGGQDLSVWLEFPTTKAAYKSSVGALAKATRAGWTFKGWYDNLNSSGAALYTPGSIYETTGDLTLYARFEYVLDSDYDGYDTTEEAIVGSRPDDPEDYPGEGRTDVNGKMVRTITFDGNTSDNTVTLNPETTKAAYGSSIGALGVATRVGYDFRGWTTTKPGVSGEAVEVTVTAGTIYEWDCDITVYAIWAVKEYTLTLSALGDATGGTDGRAIATYRESSLNVTVPSVRIGYSVAGYYADEQFETKVADEDGTLLEDVLDYTDGGGKWVTTSAVTLYASWSALSCEVTFEPGTGAGISTTGKSVFYDEVEGFPVPTKTGYDFLGWYSGAGGTGSSVTSTDGALVTSVAGYTLGGKWVTTSAVTLYASWSALSCEVTFVPGTGAGISLTPTGKSVFYDGAEGFPTPSRIGYDFLGWYSGAGGTGSSVTGTDGALLESVPGYTKDGRWATTSAVTLYAIWSALSCEVTFEPGTGAGISTTGKSVFYDEVEGFPVPTRTGYDFLGWYSGAGGTGSSVTGTDGALLESVPGYTKDGRWATTSAVTLYAIWSALSCEVTFEPGTGAGISPAPTGKSISYDGIEVFPTPSRIGYDFLGWYSEAGGTGSKVTDADGALVTAAGYTFGGKWATTSAVTLHASWSALSYEITFDRNSTPNNDAVSLDFTTMPAVYGSSLGALAKATRAGYTFKGWYDATTTSSLEVKRYSSGSSYFVAKNLTLYAIFIVGQDSDYDGYSNSEEGIAGTNQNNPDSNPEKFGITHEIAFNKNMGGNHVVWLSGPTTRAALYGSAVGELPTATTAGFTFKGWYNNSASSSGVLYTPGTIYLTLGYSLNLYACFNPGQDSDYDGYNATEEAFAGSRPDDSDDYPSEERTYANGKMIRTITFDKNAGASNSAVSFIPDGHPSTVRAVYNSPSAAEFPSLHWDRHDFRGWATTEPGISGEAVEVTAGTIYGWDRDITVHAIWVDDSDEDHYSDEEEENAGSDPNDPEDNPGAGETKDGKMVRTIYFDGNAESYNSSVWIGSTTMEAVYGSSLPALTKATRAGYTFKGWYDAPITASGVKLYSSGSSYFVARNLTLYAIFIGGQDSDYDGYNATEEAFAGSRPDDSDDYPSEERTDVNGKMVRTITFDGNTGDTGDLAEPSPTTTRAVYSSSMSLATAIRAGYDFKGWTTTEPGISGEAVEVTAGTIYGWDHDITVYAIWAASKYTLTLSALGLGTDGEAVATYRESPLDVSPQSVREGYSVAGYYADEQFETEVADADGALTGSALDYTDGDGKWITTSAVTLYASWSAISYEITFDGNTSDGAVSLDFATMEAVYGSSLGALAKATRSGYTFKGWYDKTTTEQGMRYSSGSSYSVPENLTLYAIFVEEDDLDYDGYSDREETEAGSNTNSAIDRPDEENLDENGKMIRTITFSKGLATWVELPTTKAVAYGSPIEDLPRATRSGFTFGGWRDNLNQSKGFYTPGSIYETIGDLTLTAWLVSGLDSDYDDYSDAEEEAAGSSTNSAIDKPDEENLKNGKMVRTIYFDKNSTPSDGAVSLDFATMEAVYGSSLGALAKATRSGYTFKGWYDKTTTEQGMRYSSGSSYFIPGNLTLYAIFIEGDDLDGDGYNTTEEAFAGSDPDDANDRPDEENLDEDSKTMVRTIYFDRNSTPSDDAVWLDFDTTKAAYGSSLGALAKATRAGYTFKGWYDETTTEQGMRYSSGSSYFIPRNLTLYAIFVEELDSDFDGYSDREETEAGSNPNNATDRPDEANLNSDGKMIRTVIFRQAIGVSHWLEFTQQKVAYGSSLGALAKATRAGYTFRGWYDNQVPSIGALYTPGSIYKTTRSAMLNLYPKFIEGSDSDFDGYSDAEEEDAGSSTNSAIDKPDEENLKNGKMVRTIYFDENASGDAVSVDFFMTKAAYKSSVGVLPGVARQNYTFKGWYDNQVPSDGALYTPGSIYETIGDLTLYAIFIEGDDLDFDGYSDEEEGDAGSRSNDPNDRPDEENLDENSKTMVRTITFDKNSEGEVSLDSTTMRAVYGSSLGALATATCSGYTFKGWYDNKTWDQGMRYSSGSSYFVIGNLTLYAIFIESQDSDYDGYSDFEENVAGTSPSDAAANPGPAHEITFNRNLGQEDSNVSLEFSTTTAVYGSPIGDLPKATHASYTFKGWYDKENWREAKRYTPGSLLIALEYSLNLYAGFELGKDSDFDGYSDEEEKTAGSRPNDAEDNLSTGEAVGGKMVRTITFDENASDSAVSLDFATKRAVYGSSVGGLATATRSWHTFKGWWYESETSDEGGAEELYTPGSIYSATKDITLYAKWEDDNDGDGFTNYEEATAGSNSNDANDKPDEENLDNGKMIRTITFDKNFGGENDDIWLEFSTTRAVFDSSIGVLARATHASYTFKGWRDSSNPAKGVYTPGSIYETIGNLTLYAIFSNEPDDDFDGYSDEEEKTAGSRPNDAEDNLSTGEAVGGKMVRTITFDGNIGDTGDPVELSMVTKKAIYDSPIEALGAATRAGYDFRGWTTTVSGVSGEAVGATVTAGTIYGWDCDITAYAIWAASKYTLTLSVLGLGEDGEAVASYGEDSLDVTDSPERVGYTVAGYYADDQFETKVAGTNGALLADVPGYTKNGRWATGIAVTLYVSWSALSCKVTFEPGDGASSPAEKYVFYDGTEKLPVPIKTGHGFLGWYSEEEGTGSKVTDVDGALVTAAGYTGYTKDGRWATTSAVTLYAIWSVLSYEVTFEGDGADVSPTGKYISYGGIEVFPTPSKIGHDFLGWYSEEGGAGSEVTDVNGALLESVPGYTNDSGAWATTSAVTLYAIWSALSYKVTFEPGEGIDVSPTEKYISYGGVIAQEEGFPVPSRIGYDFAGWYSEAGGAGSKVADANGALVSNATGYTDDGKWATASAVTLYAGWSALSCKVTFEGDGADVSPTEKSIFYDGTEGLPVPIKTGHGFLGWYLIEGETESKVTDADGALLEDVPGYTNDSGAWVTTSAVTLHAIWSVLSYKVTFEGDGVDVSPTEKYISYGGMIAQEGNFPVPSRIGYDFSGWYSGAGETGSKVADVNGALLGDVPGYTDGEKWTTASAVTLYAGWSALSYEVTFESGEGESAEKYVSYGGIEVFPTPSRIGYGFSGWHSGAGGSGSKVTDVNGALLKGVPGYTDGSGGWATISAVELHASWSALSYRVTFVPGDGANVSPAEKYVFYDGTEKLPVPSKTGHGFLGWYLGEGETENKVTDEDGALLENVPGYTNDSGAWVTTSAVTLYADWSALSYEVTFEPGEGTVSLPTKGAVYGSSIGALAKATRAGYTFRGWYDNEVRYSSDSLYLVAGNLTLRARFDLGQDSDYDGYSDEEEKTAGSRWSNDPEDNPGTGETVGGKMVRTITFDKNPEGEVWLDFATKRAVYGSPVGALAKATRSGYTFKGWYDAPNQGTHYVQGYSYLTLGGLTLYAKFVHELDSDYDGYSDAEEDAARTDKTSPNDKPDGAFEIIFDKNSAEGNDSVWLDFASTRAVYDLSSPIGTLAKATRAGYTFKGWYDNSNERYTVTSVLPTEASITLYARFVLGLDSDYDDYSDEEEKTAGSRPDDPEDNLSKGEVENGKMVRTITFDASGGTNLPTTRAVYDSPLSPNGLPVTSRSGYIFRGWRTSSGEKVTEGSIYSWVSDLTLYAIWEAPPAVVSIQGPSGGKFSFKASGKGNTVQLKPVVSSYAGATLSWSSNNRAIADVNRLGLVTFKGPEGTVRIVVTAKNDAGSSSKSIDIKVTKNVTSIRTPMTKVYLQAGKSLTLPVVQDDSTKPGTPVASKLTWTTSNKKAVTVANGKIKAAKVKKKTTAKIIVKAANGRALTITVYVLPKASKIKTLKVSGLSKTGKVGRTMNINIKVAPATATNLVVTFKSSSTKIATVDKDGRVIFKKKGKVTITVKVGTKSFKQKITVK